MLIGSHRIFFGMGSSWLLGTEDSNCSSRMCQQCYAKDRFYYCDSIERWCKLWPKDNDKILFIAHFRISFCVIGTFVISLLNDPKARNIRSLVTALPLETLCARPLFNLELLFVHHSTQVKQCTCHCATKRTTTFLAITSLTICSLTFSFGLGCLGLLWF